MKVRPCRLLALIAVVPLLPIASPAADKPPAVDAAYQQSFDKWKSELADDMRKNWASLAGLFWLKPGENSFGTDKANAIVFPKGPAHAGVFVLQGEDVTVKFAPGVDAKIAGKAASEAKLDPDASGHATLVELGSLQMHVIKRGARTGIRVKDLQSPEAAKYAGPVFFPIDLHYRVTATWKPSDGKQTVDVPNVLGDVTSTPAPGTAVFKINGQEYSLTALSGDPKDGFFFVFNDLTSKTDTYPGGRFLETDAVSNGSVVLDFNRAYSPPCSVTPYATCPLAPKENRLSIAIPVGEKYDRKHSSH